MKFEYVCAPTGLQLAGGGIHVTENDLTGPEVTGSDPEVTSFDRKSPGSGCRRPISQLLGTFKLLQGSNSQEVAVKWQEMTSQDRKLPEVTRK